MFQFNPAEEHHVEARVAYRAKQDARDVQSGHNTSATKAVQSSRPML